jgi:hypothetical protein
LSSISVFSVGLRITRLNGSSIARYQVSSAIARDLGLQDDRALLRVDAAPSQSLTISIVLSRISPGLSARVVNACMFAIRK